MARRGRRPVDAGVYRPA